jgi:hypothetical protein
MMKQYRQGYEEASTKDRQWSAKRIKAALHSRYQRFASLRRKGRPRPDRLDHEAGIIDGLKELLASSGEFRSFYRVMEDGDDD